MKRLVFALAILLTPTTELTPGHPGCCTWSGTRDWRQGSTLLWKVSAGLWVEVIMTALETIKTQAKHVAEQMRTLTRDERLEVLEAFLGFCRFCGDDETVNGPCYCMNDE